MSIRYSQYFKDSLIKLHQEGRSLKSAQKSINWTIFIQLLRKHLRCDGDYKNFQSNQWPLGIKLMFYIANKKR